MNLFPDQIRPVTETVAHLKNGKNVILVAPTASGKTVMGAFVAREFRKVIFIVNKTVLVSQSYDRFVSVGHNASVIHNTIRKNLNGDLMNIDWENSNVVISLVESFENTKIDIDADLVMIDEAHKATSITFQQFRDKYPKAVFCGLSATPGRPKNKEGELLADWYDIMVIGDTIQNLISKGRLARPVYKNYDETDHVVNSWLAETTGATNRRTIVFARNATQMIELHNAFTSNGINAEIVTSGSEIAEAKDILKNQTSNQRNEIFNRFRAGETEVLISWGALAEGFDEPSTMYVIINRSIGSDNVSLYHQIVGRALRSFPGKIAGTILDFGGNFETFGPIEEYVWEMDGTGHKETHLVNNGDTIHYGHFARKPIVYVKCDCHHVYNVSKFECCPACAFVNKVKITATFKQMKEFFYQEVDEAGWKKFTSGKFVDQDDAFWRFFDICQKALTQGITEKFNTMYFEVFENGKFNRKYSWMNVLVNNRRQLKSTDKVEFEI